MSLFGSFVAACTVEVRRQVMLFRCDYDLPGHFRRTILFPAEVNFGIINICLKELSGEDPPMFPDELGYIHPGPLSPGRRCLLEAFNAKICLEFDGKSPSQMFTFLRRCSMAGTVIETFTADARRQLKQSLEFWGNEGAVAEEFGRMFRVHDQYLCAIDEDEREGMWEDMERWVRGGRRWGCKSGVEWPRIPTEVWELREEEGNYTGLGFANKKAQ